MSEILERDISKEVLHFDAESLDPGSLRYDLLMALPAFHNLLNTCIKRYLTDPDDLGTKLAAVQAARQTPTTYAPFSSDSDVPSLNSYTPIQPSEGPLVSKVGGWGILAAEVSIALGPQAKIVDQRWLQAAMRSPELFAQPADPWVADRITAFGQAYMCDMYACVGLTAPEPADNLSIDEQFDALKGLFFAVHKLGQTEGDISIPFDEDEIANMLSTKDMYGRPYYDPLLLSPKAFPNNLGADPTCAAQMAIFAGFCEAAGWPHMTANTLALGEVYSKACLGRVTSETLRLLDQNGNIVHPMDYQAILQTMTSISNTMKRDLGFHGCNLVRLADGKWWQWDLTRGVAFPYPPVHSQRLDIAYDSLQVGRQENTPMMQPFNEVDFLTLLDELSQAAEESTKRMLSLDYIKQQLDTFDKRSTLDDLVDQLILPAILPKPPKGSAFFKSGSEYRQLITKDVPYWLQSAVDGEEYVRQAARELLTNLGFVKLTRSREASSHKSSHDNQPCRDECLTEALVDDEAYRLLAHWIRTAPIMFYQKLANDLCKLSITPGHLLAHPSLELTNPAMYLGVTVLSAYADIYAKVDEQLPAAWWPTYDPTHSGSLTHIYDALGTSGIKQTVNLINLLGHLPSFSLQDTSKSSRMEEFLRNVKNDSDAK